jgi:pyruvate/2-oxoglutarate dehydrogenase complex dihydrolipoamide acyltransferase (E2) component
MKVTLKLPRLSMNMMQATITEWHKNAGDRIVEGETLYVVETEKVTSEVPSPTAGTLLEILAGPGSELEVGDPVCRVETATP